VLIFKLSLDLGSTTKILADAKQVMQFDYCLTYLKT